MPALAYRAVVLLLWGLAIHNSFACRGLFWDGAAFLANLIDNAVKYSDSGSSVEVSATLMRDRVDFAVADHGMGIASQHLDRIFERFCIGK